MVKTCLLPLTRKCKCQEIETYACSAPTGTKVEDPEMEAHYVAGPVRLATVVLTVNPK